MEPLEDGRIQPLGLSHAIGPPGWRPYFRGEFPRFSRVEHPKPDHQSLWWTFPLAPPSPPPLAPPLAQGPTAGRFQGPGATRPISVLDLLAPLSPSGPLAPPGFPAPPGPPWPTLAPLAPPWPSLAPPAPLAPPPDPPWPSLAALSGPPSGPPGPPWPPPPPWPGPPGRPGPPSCPPWPPWTPWPSGPPGPWPPRGPPWPPLTPPPWPPPPWPPWPYLAPLDDFLPTFCCLACLRLCVSKRKCLPFFCFTVVRCKSAKAEAAPRPRQRWELRAPALNPKR